MKANRQAGIHLHKTKKTIRHGRNTKSGVPAIGPLTKEEFYWILIARNGKTIARSSETYKRKAGAVKSIVVSVGILLGSKPYDIITYHDHTLEGSPIKYY